MFLGMPFAWARLYWAGWPRLWYGGGGGCGGYTRRVLAWAAAVPAASAKVLPANDFGDYEPARATGTTVRVITAGGMPGWQIAVIALAAALVAAAAAVFLDRARTSRRSAASAG